MRFQSAFFIDIMKKHFFPLFYIKKGGKSLRSVRLLEAIPENLGKLGYPAVLVDCQPKIQL